MLTPRQARIAATAGPENWGFLISGDHADLAPEAASPLISVALRQQCNTLESALSALSGLAGATLILTHSLAAQSTCNALNIYRRCQRAANATEGPYTPIERKRAISAANKILYSRDPLALSALLIDIIRIANHITKD
nr:MAG TPA: hypothetical protein [Caudoviricetes sp.]